MPNAQINTETERICGVQETDQWHENLFPNDDRTGKLFRVGAPLGTGYVRDFIVIGCAAYKLPYQPSSGDPRRRSVYVYDLAKREYGKLIDLRGENIPAADLVLTPHPEHGTYAN
jgi:hypothetical protein